MYYYTEREALSGTIKHIYCYLPDGGVMSFPLSDDNPNKAAYDAWVAEGNTAEEWNPQG